MSVDRDRLWLEYATAYIAARQEATRVAVDTLAVCRQHWPWFMDLEADIRGRMERDAHMTLKRAYALSLAVMARGWM